MCWCFYNEADRTGIVENPINLLSRRSFVNRNYAATCIPNCEVEDCPFVSSARHDCNAITDIDSRSNQTFRSCANLFFHLTSCQWLPTIAQRARHRDAVWFKPGAFCDEIGEVSSSSCRNDGRVSDFVHDPNASGADREKGRFLRKITTGSFRRRLVALRPCQRKAFQQSLSMPH